MPHDEFIAKWSTSAAAERANKDQFLIEFCGILGVAPPNPTVGDPKEDTYVFERDARFQREGHTTSVGKIDLYKEGAFILEAKQGSTQRSKKLGTARRDTPAWQMAMKDAFGQALGYARTFDVPPPFIIVIDIGYCFDLFASFDGTHNYRPFPNAAQSRLFLGDLADHVEVLRAIWEEPGSLDPALISAKVTREVASHLAELARALEADGHPPDLVATFLMRCLFTMFAEDVGLLPDGLFTNAIQEFWLPNPASFPGGITHLWRSMNDGAPFSFFGNLLRFNGGLFKAQSALPLKKEHLELLYEAAICDWSDVEPAIFGTLLERALDPGERHSLGAHYTPKEYVERLVRPTIEEPLREEWGAVQAEVRTLVRDDKLEKARKKVKEFHRHLASVKVLDPACGSGNFLYVTLDIFKRLEAEILTLLEALGEDQSLLNLESIRVTPAQFLGIEVKRWAKEIAELVLWIGYLQWHFRTYGRTLQVPEPVLQDYGNIECRDAVLAYDREELVLDDKGKPVTRWDGITTKEHPVTGKEVPDDSARVPLYRYVNPRKAEWPRADFVVGNPPFIGNSRMRQELGDGYAEAIRSTYPDVPESVDYVMYWWDKAAWLTREGDIRRFGLITTNSIRQTFARRVIERHMTSKPPLSLIFAIPDHPWVDSKDGAAVRIAMTAGSEGTAVGTLGRVDAEADRGEYAREVTITAQLGMIHANLTVGADVGSIATLASNSAICSRGVQLMGSGFIVSPDEAITLGLGTIQHVDHFIRHYRNGKDLTSRPRDVMVIDLFGLDEAYIRTRLPSIYQWVVERVKPERDQNKRKSYRDNWWIFGEPRKRFRPSLEGVSRYISTVETSKHRFFTFLDKSILPDNKLINISLDDAFFLGVLSSRVHVTWSLAAGGRLGVGNDPVYVKTKCFDPFPFPACSEARKAAVRDVAEELDAHRKRQLAAHGKLTMTGMYNVLEKLRAGEALTPKERTIHDEGLVTILHELHDRLDEAVFEAYGWPSSLTDDEILERIVALNHERSREERDGKIRWLRPEYQAPSESTDEQATTTTKATKEVAAAADPKSLLPWAKKTDLPKRLSAVRELLRSRGGSWTVNAIASSFKKARAKDIEEILESLQALGLVVASTEEGELSWMGVD